MTGGGGNLPLWHGYTGGVPPLSSRRNRRVRDVYKRQGIEYARQAMVDYRNKALALLPQSAGQAVKDALTAYIDYVIERDK